MDRLHNTQVLMVGGASVPGLTPLGAAGTVPTVNAGGTALEYTAVSGTGTVTSVSVVTANGVSASVANATTTPAATFTLGAITPDSVNSVVISGSSTPTLAVTGTTAVSGTNTGDNATNSQYSGLVSNATHTGDATGSTSLTLATVNSNVGSFGSATASVALTVNGKGLVTAASASTITPAVGSITGLGTGVATALAVNTGSAGAFVTYNGALGTPSSGTLTSCTIKVELGFACSDETTAITAGTNKLIFRMPFAMTLTAVRASVTTAPTGSTIIIDINESGSTILSTKLSIDTSEKTSTTAASAAVISDASLADDAEMSIDFDQVGSTIAGAGVKVWLIGTRT